MIRTPVRAPKANAVCKRFIGSVRRECLDHIFILRERQLYRLIGDYVAYFNHTRPHQGLNQCIPDPQESEVSGAESSSLRIVGYPVLGGLHHDYRRAVRAKNRLQISFLALTTGGSSATITARLRNAHFSSRIGFWTLRV